ncbi:MAG: D-alanine--D-alanine ligase family protein [bacterium]
MKQTIAVISGGTNSEHEVSLSSTKAILANLDKKKYKILPLQITKENKWIDEKGRGVNPFDLPKLSDVVFPVLHGPYGEDGTIQGLLKLLHLPYVGCGVTASALCMDKVLQKNVCQSYHLPVVPFFWFTKGEWDENRASVLSNLSRKLPTSSFPLFVKPANQGSSVGITKVKNKKELVSGIQLAFTRDTKVLVEQGVKNVREIECSVLGPNHAPESSVLGEIIPGNKFYDYNAKYLDNNSEAIIPAKLPAKLAGEIRATASLAFQVLDCFGLARVDFLLNSKTKKFYLNELNTMPGFTPISMYPKLWETSGLPFPKLLDKLINLALIRHQEKLSLSLNH